MNKQNNDIREFNIPSRIKFFRKEKGLTQKQLAELSGISFSMISKIESGERTNPSLETLEKIGQVIDLTLDDLFGKNSLANKIFSDDIRFISELMENLKPEESNPILDMIDSIRLILNNYPSQFNTIEHITTYSMYIGMIRALTTNLENICVKQTLLPDEDFNSELFDTYTEHKNLINSILDSLFKSYVTQLKNIKGAEDIGTRENN